MKPIAAALVFLFWAAPAFASIEYCQVIHVSGHVEIQTAGDPRWRPLAAPRLLAGGDKLRAFSKSYAELSSSRDFSALMMLSAESEVEVMGDDLTRFFLRRGGFAVLYEEEVGEPRPKGEFFQVLTKQFTVRLDRGGAAVTAFAGGSAVRVFAETARVDSSAVKGKGFSRIVPEGFRFFAPTGVSQPAEPARMQYADYKDWQAWVRRCYKRKDDRTEAQLLKG